MDVVDIDDLISKGESDEVEFKSSARWDYREGKQNKVMESVIAKTIAGFLNGNGGIVIVGIDDDGNVLGLEKDYGTLSKRPDRDGYQQFLVNLVSSCMGKDSCAYLSVSFQPAKGQEICVIRVNRSSRPVYIQEGQQTRFYVRTGNATQELGTKESVDYISSHWAR